MRQGSIGGSMKYTNFADSGLILSRICFGAMTFGQGTLVAQLVNDISQKTADQMIEMCLNSGVNFFDTADAYTSGQSEIMLGRALKSVRSDVVIATKCGFRFSDTLLSSGLSYRYIIKSVQDSLKRLDTDYIDLFQVHIPDPFTPLEETVRALDDVVRKGLVRYVGYCNYPAWQAQKMLSSTMQGSKSSTCFISAQMYYSLLCRDIEFDTVPFLQANGLGLMVWSPLAGGFLSGKYPKNNAYPSDSRRAKFDFPPIELEKGYKVVEKLQSISEKYNASCAQLAISYVLSKPFVSSVIIGANKINQLEDNLKACDITLSDEDLHELDELTNPIMPYPAWMTGMGRDTKVNNALWR
ncbi:oxidoreductase, aryl-alcohol dehydrogenase like protein [Candidatus Magnetoovum chiemensis]|nr:oxidoreductase, aryl-alcohol dehydrogenase like protein [Candidatus Magnetoovum chiemensis]